MVCEKLRVLREVLPDEQQLAYLHRIDNVVFSHGSLADAFIWYRPQYYEGGLYKPRKLLQVVGHTLVETISRKGNLSSGDVFSTDRNGDPIGTQEYLVIETRDWTFEGRK